MWGKLLAPFAALLLVFLFARPVKKLVERRMKDGRLKRLLLLRWD